MVFQPITNGAELVMAWDDRRKIADQFLVFIF
jgi:hypothetical protein